MPNKTTDANVAYDEFRRKAAAAQEMASRAKTPDEMKAAKDLIAEARSLKEKADLIKEAAGFADSLQEADREEREAIRTEAERTARRPMPEGVPADAVPDDEDLANAETVAGEARSAKDTAGLSEFLGAFGEWQKERRARGTDNERRQFDAFNRAVRGGTSALSPEERRILVRKVGTEERTMTVGEASKLGILIPPAPMREIEAARKAFGGFRDTATEFVQTTDGRTIPMPYFDDTGNEGTFVGETTSLSADTDPSVQGAELAAYGLRSGVFKVSFDLLQDEQFGLETWLLGLAAVRNERRFQRAMTTGDGTKMPQGLASVVNAGHTTATGQTTSLKYEDWVKAWHSCQAPYRGEGEWMVGDDALLAAMLMETGDARPLWVPGVAAGAPNRILARPYAVNYHMADLAASAVVAMYGAFRYYKAREVNPPVILRLTERYADDMAVGFVQYYRVDGRFEELTATGAEQPIQGLKMAAS